MWIIGGLVGLVVGAFFESMTGALILGIAGALGAGPLFRMLASRSVGAKSRTDGLRGSLLSDENSAGLDALRRRVDALSRRVEELEAAASRAPLPVSDAAKPLEAANGPHAIESVPALDPDLLSTFQTEPVPDDAVMQAAAVGLPQPTATPVAAELAPTEVASLPDAAALPPLGVQRPPPRPPSLPLRDRLPAPLRKLIFGGNALVKIGVLILFLGLAFLLSYTAERVTVPVELRYAMVAAAGAGLLVIGWLLRRRRRDYGLILQGAGIGVFYLTTLGAMKLSELLPPTIGFAFLFAVALLSALLAVLQNAPSLAIVAALEGFAAPVLASTGENRPVGLFTYLLVLDLGVFFVAWFRAWRLLNLIGLVGTFTLAAGWAERFYTADQYGVMQPFLIVFFLMFAAIGLLFARRTLVEAPGDADLPLAARAQATLRRVGRVDSSQVFGAPMAAFALQYLLVKGWEFGSAFSALLFGAFYLGLGRFVFATQPRGLMLLAEAYAIVGVIFATLALPLAFDGHWTGAAWAIEAAGMYWLGIRQQRPYSRAFSFALVAGAVVQLLRDVAVVDVAGAPLLHGSLLGPLLMAGGVFAIWRLQRRARLDQGSGWEALGGTPLPWIGVAALTLLPWQTLVPAAAASATALMAVAVFAVSLRCRLVPLRAIAQALQLLAVLAFITTLHWGPAEGGAIDGGPHGTLQAALIVLSVLATAAWSTRLAHRAALATGIAPAWTAAQIIGTLAGVALAHLAMLLALDLPQAALVWPVTALVVLWVALRLSHPSLAALAAVLQAAAAMLFLGSVAMRVLASRNPYLSPFAHLAFWTPLALGLTALLAGDWLRGEARHAGAPEASTGRRRWLNGWSVRPFVLWLPVIWGLLWWLAAVLTESARVLAVRGGSDYLPAVTVFVLLGTSVVAMSVATRRDWRQLGRATLATSPALMLTAYAAVTAKAAITTDAFLPSAALGWLAWPLALVWHLGLLRLQERWIQPGRLGPWHIAGVWFFLLLAARECHFQFGRFGSDLLTWPLLGWVLVPTIVLWVLCSPALQQRWPLVAHRRAYIEIASAPVAAFLYGWCLLSNVISAGDAAPLPYVPLLNPLELAQALALTAITLWWKARPPAAWPPLSNLAASRVAAVTGWVLLTGMVLRSCHHYLGVPWEAGALYASWPTEAALSLTWAMCGVVAMVLGTRRASRPVWIAGAVLIGIVVLKLFFVEFADRGGLFRIVSFIGVGALLLLVGYFAPVPPAAAPLKEQAA